MLQRGDGGGRQALPDSALFDGEHKGRQPAGPDDDSSESGVRHGVRTRNERKNRSGNLDPETTLNGLADKGFHTGEQLAKCKENNITTYVAIPQPGDSGKDKHFTKEVFDYEAGGDVYVCRRVRK